MNIGFIVFMKKLEAWPWRGCFTMSPPLKKIFFLGGGGPGSGGVWSIKNDNICINKGSSNEET